MRADAKVSALPTLIEESPPTGAPAGVRAYRFRVSDVIIVGKLSAIKIESGHPVYVAAPEHSFRAYPQSALHPQDSHVFIMPGGSVDPRLLRPTGTP